MKIRIMCEADADRIAELEQISFARPWSRQGLLDTMLGGQAVFLAAEVEDELAGYVGMTYAADEGEITNIAVFPHMKRQGVGEGLMKALTDFARTIGVNTIFLDVRVSNAPAIALYEKTGYISCGVRKRFYDLPTEDAIIMKYVIKE